MGILLEVGIFSLTLLIAYKWRKFI